MLSKSESVYGEQSDHVQRDADGIAQQFSGFIRLLVRPCSKVKTCRRLRRVLGPDIEWGTPNEGAE